MEHWMQDRDTPWKGRQVIIKNHAQTYFTILRQLLVVSIHSWSEMGKDTLWRKPTWTWEGEHAKLCKVRSNLLNLLNLHRQQMNKTEPHDSAASEPHNASAWDKCAQCTVLQTHIHTIPVMKRFHSNRFTDLILILLDINLIQIDLYQFTVKCLAIHIVFFYSD